MLQNIEKKLLLKYPLIWNTKFVPMLVFGILLHIIFFILGYVDGTIDFSNQDNIDIETMSILFGSLVVTLVIIVWLVFYFKNNSLKSFYKKSKYSLFYEFIQILAISTLLATFYIPFSIAKQLHQRSYYSLIETQNRCKTISTADIFIDGNFKRTEIDSLASGLIDSLGNLTSYGKQQLNLQNGGEYYAVERIKNGDLIYKDYIVFNGKKYDEYSLLNRNIYGFSVNTREQDSLNELEVKNWLHNNNKGQVSQLLSNYLSLLREHNLETNITLDNWIKSTYTNPNFEDFLYIHPYKNEYEADPYYKNYNSRTLDYFTNNDKTKYSKFFIQQDILKEKYNTVSNAHTSSFIDIEALIVFLYIALGISILIFSFRVTSGKSWLISVVAMGVINLFSGILAAIISTGNFYVIILLATIIMANIYFIVVYLRKEKIKFSRIALNIALWGNPFVIPIIYNLIKDFYYLNYYNHSNYSRSEYTEYQWLRDHSFDMAILNYLLIILCFFFIAKVVRNWKGIPED